MNITMSGALWGDVFIAGNGLIGCAYDSGNLVLIDYFAFNGESISYKYSQTLQFDERVLFIRAAKNRLGHVLVMGQGNKSGNFCIKSIGGNYPDPHYSTYGTHVCDLYPTDTGFEYVVVISTTQYFDSGVGRTFNLPVPGTSQGIVQLLPTTVRWADIVRTDVPEMLYPFIEEGIYVGEGASDPPHIQALEGTEQINVEDAVANRPRCCYDEQSNTFAIVASSNAGVTFYFYNLPLKKENPVACTPVVPPQNIIADSTAAIRNFCQNYVAPSNSLPEYVGRKPYVGDEIHQNGLFLSDGILYFMMSDTGRWAQVLMNPDDKRDWDSKRRAADDALFHYMKARVGDPSASQSVGSLSGNVNVNG